VLTDRDGIQKRKYLLSRLSAESASRFKFEYNGRWMTVADYYQKERKIP
jgi:hypothetical protein